MGPLLMIFGVVLMVVIHEAGHFVAAKIFGMKATEAFFGFGPRLWSTRRGETEYGVKALPLGGYVRIIGMNPFEEVAPEDEHRTYRGKPFWQKAVVVLAGIFSHFVVAFILFFVLATVYGTPEAYPEVDLVSAAVVVPDDSEDAVPWPGRPSDEIVSVDGVAFDEVDPARTPSGELSTVVVRRDGATMEIATTDALVPSPAYRSGLQPGDRLVSVDGVAVTDWASFVGLTQARPDTEATLVIERGGETLSVPTLLASREAADGARVGFLGVAPVVRADRAGPLEGAGIAGSELGSATAQSVRGLGSLVGNFGSLLGAIFGQDDAILDEVRPVSPIGLTRAASTVEVAVALLAYVNVFVGVLNVVPLYPLDGGHFIVALYEKIRGRAADVRKLIPLAAAVWLFIIMLGVLGIYLDIVDPIQLTD